MRFRHATLFTFASSRSCPRRLPKNVITLGTPAFAAFGIISVSDATMPSWNFVLLMPSGIDRTDGKPVEHVSPKSRLAIVHSSSVRRSIAGSPISAHALKKSVNGILL